MTVEARERAETHLTERFDRLPIPNNFQITLDHQEETLCLASGDEDAWFEPVTLHKSEVDGLSSVIPDPSISSWDRFREWAIDQYPRKFIFRGQSNPYKLSSTFHRTWRKCLYRWIVDDVRMLYGAMFEQISYPIQIGDMAHNAAFWSILQHHGYPTPLLDWTYSPFVAAYFAIAPVMAGDHSNPRIFILDQEKWNSRYGKAGFIADPAPPQLIVLESYRFGNPRAAPQQALATISNVADIEGYIRAREIEDKQTYLTVCEISAADAPRIIRELELMGITYGSLFPGLEGIARDAKSRLFSRPMAIAKVI